ncbi:hypothetical protein HX787_28310 [Pseudomonas tolaasii]|uniref:SMODS-associating 2TM beta-strand rich effector domain-containing protein n=3 Tax=Pseudomonas tolaasii TaxID=29442 RepID=A0A7Y8DUW8_PSETO|nr:hypothetical protein [Pseudomonas tolaasii]ARB31263.1 hypothetical protein B5P22_29460 [Pseudomonas tolaasii]KAB0466515.1 hypothetical protein F7R12_27490 [Pseudomonas tolaasii]MBY8943498.1 hypothetical protein [Pseudomonas tolaasii]NVZ45408.1 hypothetical protein [Pseudomonas tolaasii]NWA48612.1 hypothetical protein [Pseudomonas tolaasii]
MYQVIGITKTLGYFASTCVLVFLVMHYKDISVLVTGPLIDLGRPISSAVTIGASVFWVLGQSPLFVWLCRVPLVRKYLPPIEGDWDMQLKSNWGIKQKWLGQGAGTSLISVPGKVKIYARLFSVKMEFTSADRYSESKTISVSVRSSDQTGLLELNYMFVNFTQIPVATDTNTHTGAARVFVKESGDELYMEGTYFTDRKWTEGLNTAGQVTFTRAKSA